MDIVSYSAYWIALLFSIMDMSHSLISPFTDAGLPLGIVTMHDASRVRPDRLSELWEESAGAD